MWTGAVSIPLNNSRQNDGRQVGLIKRSWIVALFEAVSRLPRTSLCRRDPQCFRKLGFTPFAKFGNIGTIPLNNSRQKDGGQAGLIKLKTIVLWKTKYQNLSFNPSEQFRSHQTKT